eukprot:342838_1
MKICIKITKPLIHNDNNNKFSVIIRKIINCFEQSNINDFMFILRLNEINKNEIFNGLKDKISSNVAIQRHIKTIIFKNTNCNINGIHGKWIKEFLLYRN